MYTFDWFQIQEARLRGGEGGEVTASRMFVDTP